MIDLPSFFSGSFIVQSYKAPTLSGPADRQAKCALKQAVCQELLGHQLWTGSLGPCDMSSENEMEAPAGLIIASTFPLPDTDVFYLRELCATRQ